MQEVKGRTEDAYRMPGGHTQSPISCTCRGTIRHYCCYTCGGPGPLRDTENCLGADPTRGHGRQALAAVTTQGQGSTVRLELMMVSSLVSTGGRRTKDIGKSLPAHPRSFPPDLLRVTSSACGPSCCPSWNGQFGTIGMSMLHWQVVMLHH